MTGLAAGVATGIVLLVPRLRALLGLVAVAGVVAAGVYTAVHQSAVHAPVNGSWPTYFGTASQLAWVAVVFLGADAAVAIVLRAAGIVVGAVGPTGGRRSRTAPAIRRRSNVGPGLPAGAGVVAGAEAAGADTAGLDAGVGVEAGAGSG